MREFDSGAIRDSDDGKLDYEGCQSPLVMERYAQYMMEHCTQADGKKRSTDNWQKGFGLSVLIKSMFRHFVAVWFMHRGLRQGDITDSLCALKFNVDGYLYEVLEANQPKVEYNSNQDPITTSGNIPPLRTGNAVQEA
jgi:hypothetical protein